MKNLYLPPSIEIWDVQVEQCILSNDPTPWGGEGAGDEENPGF